MQAAALTILAAVVVGVINLLFVSKGRLAKSVRPFAWTILLAVGLWYWHEWQRPDYYFCEACGLEYTCEDEEGQEPHGYCEKTTSHKHSGGIVKRYDFARGVGQAIGWTRRDMERVKWAFSTESADAPTKPEENG